jgi:NOL1/NOP2/sun family putative RNA methylase
MGTHRARMAKMRRGKPTSIGEARSRLPRDFLDILSASFSPHIVDRILHGMGDVRASTLRVNTLSWDARSLIRFFLENAVKHRRVLWYPDAFLLVDARERDAEGWPPYREGRIYLQSLSSMVPALVLDPRPGEEILDIAAAPGSKTTQICALMGDRGAVLANESNPIRAERLRYNVRLQGCGTVEVRVGRGEKLGDEMPSRFDRVLLDAPCSGEGRFIASNASTYRAWSPKTIAENVRLQRRLFASAVRVLKPGGTIVYSTCTLNTEENEKIADWALANLPLEMQPISLGVPAALPAFTDGVDPSIQKAMRILPSREMEGFFVCRMRKTGA